MKGDKGSEVFISRRTEAGKNHSLLSSLWVSVVLTHCAQMSSTLSIREAATTLGEESSNFRTVLCSVSWTPAMSAVPPWDLLLDPQVARGGLSTLCCQEALNWVRIEC